MGVQVQTATKNGEGKSLSILNRQFISFSYGGKDIEDFDLLASFANDRLNKEIYATFKDTTTNQAELDGQMFWRSTFEAGKLTFDLVTDGMTASQVEEFKNWFCPGIEKELILSENHNRGIKARIASAPQLSLLPFEKEILVSIGNNKHKTKTSLYKGDIKLEFVMDDPYWYSLKSVIEEITPESLKIIQEDGIPHPNMLTNECLLANNKRYYGSGIDDIDDGIVLNSSPNYLYYCGTAKANPILEFTFSPVLNGEQYQFKSLKKGELAKIQIGNKSMSFSLPDLLTSYNKVIDIVKGYSVGNSILELRKKIRDNVYNYYIRSYAIGIIDIERKNALDGKIPNGFFDSFEEKMPKFLKNDSIKVLINCKTGQVEVSAEIASIDKEESQSIIENAGNMIKSNYLSIEERKLPKDGFIGKEQCLEVISNTQIENFKIDYKYLYL